MMFISVTPDINININTLTAISLDLGQLKEWRDKMVAEYAPEIVRDIIVSIGGIEHTLSFDELEAYIVGRPD